MFIFLNILIILFILALAYWWGVQGFFSALLHLVSVIVAASLALALWEPIAQGLLMRGTAAHYAWCLGLMLPFIILLLAVRLTLDRVIRKNMFFSTPANYLGGGICGGLAGYLTAGITILGLVNLPFGLTLGGYQPYAVEQPGNIVVSNPAGSFWVAPEHGTMAFFQMLSGNAFAVSRPMDTYRPSPIVAGVVNRLRLDTEASIVALPSTISAERYYIQTGADLTAAGATPEGVEGILANEPSGGQIIAVKVDFSNTPPGTFDNDQALRIAPTQMQLWGAGGAEDDRPLLPVAVTTLHADNPIMKLISAPLEFVPSVTGTSSFMWFYVAPADFDPQVLLVRNTRLTLTDQDKSDDVASLVAAMNYSDKPVVAKGDDDDDDDDDNSGRPTLQAMGGRVSNQVAKDYALTAAMPRSFSPNLVNGSYRHEDGRLIYASQIAVRPAKGFSSNDIAIKEMSVAQHQQAVRIELEPSGARSVLGAAIAAAGVQVAYLQDEKGDVYFPLGYAWLKSDQSMEIYYSRDNPIRAAKDVPVRNMDPGDTLYLYYAVERGVTLTTFVATPQNKQEWVPALKLPD